MTEFNKSVLEIADSDFNQLKSLLDEMRILVEASNLSVQGPPRERYFASKKAVVDLLISLSSAGIHPLAAVISRSLLNPVTDEVLNMFNQLPNILQTDSRYRMTALEGRLYGVMDWPFCFRMEFSIPVSMWSELAEQGRELVLKFLETGSETDPDYLALKAKFDPVFFAERDRLMKLPVGKKLYDHQFR